MVTLGWSCMYFLTSACSTGSAMRALKYTSLTFSELCWPPPPVVLPPHATSASAAIASAPRRRPNAEYVDAIGFLPVQQGEASGLALVSPDVPSGNRGPDSYRSQRILRRPHLDVEPRPVSPVDRDEVLEAHVLGGAGHAVHEQARRAGPDPQQGRVPCRDGNRLDGAPAMVRLEAVADPQDLVQGGVAEVHALQAGAEPVRHPGAHDLDPEAVDAADAVEGEDRLADVQPQHAGDVGPGRHHLLEHDLAGDHVPAAGHRGVEAGRVLDERRL